MNEIRTFIAVELSDEAKAELSRIQSVFQKNPDNIKWVKPDNIHLTLKFLGNIQENKSEEIENVLKKAVLGIAPFEIVLHGLGVFPGENVPRVLWVGIKDGAKQLTDIADKIETLLAEKGFPKEKRNFSAHLTLGRIKHIKNRTLFKNLLNSVIVKQVSVHVGRIVLFKSKLSSEGALHEVLQVINLTK
ncbi:MAG: RNA 2',3'-cyclic phosphodiesterase [Candidatus Omnitrophota bacterium]